MRRTAALRDAASKADAEEIATKLVPQTITIAAKAGDGGRLFGSVGAQEIVGAIDAQVGAIIDRRTLDLEAPIKDLGEHSVMCTLHPEVAFPLRSRSSRSEFRADRCGQPLWLSTANPTGIPQYPLRFN